VAKAFVGIGSNLGEPERQIEAALELLRAEDGIDVVAVSSLRETEPVGYQDQPNFLNGAAALETELSPRELLDRLLAIEQKLGRERGVGPRFGPRLIDLDLLLYGDETVDEPGLTVPHPRLAKRRFALEPLAELDPSLEIPGYGSVQDLLASA
jgi:2-amino-4-hydroxy-6-hydroxymethyldihydropteridine diphosphokinase